MAMKTYSMSFADSLTHKPEKPDRTAKRPSHDGWGGDVYFKVWPSRGALLTMLDMQGKRAPRPSCDWQPCVRER